MDRRHWKSTLLPRKSIGLRVWVAAIWLGRSPVLEPTGARRLFSVHYRTVSDGLGFGLVGSS